MSNKTTRPPPRRWALFTKRLFYFLVIAFTLAFTTFRLPVSLNFTDQSLFSISTTSSTLSSSSSPLPSPPTPTPPTTFTTITPKPITSSSISTPPLTKELASSHSRDNVIIVTWTNYHFIDFVQNWVAHLRSLNITNYLVGCMDKETAETLALQNVPLFAMYDATHGDTGLTRGEFEWGSETFFKMGRQKVELARTFTSYGLDLCLCDVDTVWINDPTDYFNTYPDADILASSDSFFTFNEVGDTGLEDWLGAAPIGALNIGLLFFRHSRRMEALCDAWVAALEADPELWDQNAFNRLVQAGGIMSRNDSASSPKHSLATGFNASLVVGVLPVAAFATGHTFFVQNLYKKQQVKPYVVHLTYQFGGASGKRHRLRERLLWLADDDAYFGVLGSNGGGSGTSSAEENNYNNRFLAFEVTKPELPPGFDEDTWSDVDMTNYHLAAAHAQLKEFRDALAMAQLLNRSIILPTFWCFCDKYWNKMDHCRPEEVPRYHLPFACPTDHILNMDALPKSALFISASSSSDSTTASSSIATTTTTPSITPIGYREYSFLQNPRLNKTMLETAVEVKASPSADHVAVGGKRHRKITVPARTLNDTELVQTLVQHARDVPLLRILGSPSAIFEAERQWRSDEERKTTFMSMFLDVLDAWCCWRPDENAEPLHPFRNDFLPALAAATPSSGSVVGTSTTAATTT